MKINIKQKDFEDKVNLQKSLSTLLKKPLAALLEKKVDSLPFCYEAEYFDDGSGFISIGVCKEVYKLFKTKRAKGQGTDENGKPIKIDKKKVAFGNVSINSEGMVDFNVQGGMMKQMQAKKTIKSIGILKKKIGDNFVITKGEAVEGGEASQEDSAVDGTGPGLFDAGQKLIQLFNSKVRQEIIPSIKKDANPTKETFVDALRKVTNYLDQLDKWLEQLEKDADDKSKELEQNIRKIKEELNKILPSIQKKAGEVIEDIKDAVGDVANEVKDRIKSFFGSFKDKIQKEVAPKVKDKKATDDDKNFVSDLLDEAKKILNDVDKAADNVKEGLSKTVDKIRTSIPNLEKLIKAIEKIISEGGTIDAALLKILEDAKKEVSASDKEIDKSEKNLKSTKREPVPGGADLVNSLK